MKKLDLEIQSNNRTYTQIKRDSYKAMYLSNDGYYEIFRVQVLQDKEVFGNKVLAHEKYPATSNFGISAWCTSSKETAEKIYNEIKPVQNKNNNEKSCQN